MRVRSRHHSCGEDQKNREDGVALPIGSAYVGMDVNERHG
jgi:hypothetical protein